jgi:hypothetical protein
LVTGYTPQDFILQKSRVFLIPPPEPQIWSIYVVHMPRSFQICVDAELSDSVVLTTFHHWFLLWTNLTNLIQSRSYNSIFFVCYSPTQA